MTRFLTVLFLQFSTLACAQNTALADSSSHTIERIYKNYIKQQDNTLGETERIQMKNALLTLQTPTQKDLALLIDVWLYFDPTDFPTRDLILPILKNNQPAAQKAIGTRIRNRKKWETPESVPYSELPGLLRQVSQ